MFVNVVMEIGVGLVHEAQKTDALPRQRHHIGSCGEHLSENNYIIS